MAGKGTCCAACKIAKLLAGIGALNWGLVAGFGFNLVERLFGSMPALERGVYIIVGIAGLMTLGSFFNLCPCSKGSCEPKK